ncbi:unnamed protein product [Symbiodinium necroappetens]|uniref:Reverse transcriptase domain-containing protein n=1 Tax=Symbiodinium necroappetens TaxID=1628268 RepID=A0A813B2F9_9DINO|nr:unnamed protein product [Symbiodinium necroappetens]
MIAILIDLETFYDCVDLQLLADRLCEAQFPPVVGALALQAYAGERHIVSEDVLSEGIKPQKGIPAGCPLAITMARVFLAPILREASTCEGLAGLDTWVDDIGVDCALGRLRRVTHQKARVGKGKRRPRAYHRAVCADRVSDPWATVVMQQVQEWFTALSRWGPEQVSGGRYRESWNGTGLSQELCTTWK